MTNIVDLDAYELHLGDEKVFNNFMMNARVFHFTYDRDWLFLKSEFVDLCEWLYMNVYKIFRECTWFSVFSERCTPVIQIFWP